MTYRQGFDHLGNPVAPVPQRWTRADRVRVAVAVLLVVAALCIGVMP